MAQSDEVWSESSESESGTSVESNEEQDDFPPPPSKRRRISLDDDSDSPQVQYSAPSRIKQAIPLNPAKLNLSPSRPVSSVPSTLTTSTFESLKVAPWLVHSLRSMAITNPTEIQRSCIPEILKGRDCIGGSKTGTGKTIAFAVPILQKWAEDPFGIYAVIITPTRELALQIYEQFLALGAPQSLKVVLVTGGSDMRPQALALAQRPHIVVATPGRLADHVQTSGKETTIGLTRAKVVVLDEADRLLASGTGSMLPDLNTCLSALPPSSSRNTLLFTATVTAEVRALQSLPRSTDRPPIFVSEITSTSSSSSSPFSNLLLPSTLTQTYLQVPLTQKDAFLHVLLQTPSFNSPPSSSPSIIIFTNRTTTADILHRTLLTLQHPVTSLHSLLPQSQRNLNLASFRSLKNRILIATDVASRGLDIPEVGIVVNYDVPRDPKDYVHRVGRTARAGKAGLSVTFVSQRDVALVLAIEEYVGGGEASDQRVDAGPDEDPPNDNPEEVVHLSTTEAGSEAKDHTPSTKKANFASKEINPAARMIAWAEEGVNIETRVIKGRVLKDVAEARMEAMREVEQGRDINGWRRGVIKKRR